MQFPVIEIVDRYAIAVVKHERTNGANREELDFYLAQMSLANINLFNEKVLELIEHHIYVWSLEDDFKKCRIDGTDLAEVGRRALEIRDYNNLRVELKNTVAEKLNDPVREIKTNV